jgi:transcriptional regulator with XRE-family HTH domain
MTRQNDINRILVRTARALLDWTQPNLVNAAGIALATLKWFEKGYRVPTDQTLAKIFSVLKKAGVEFDDNSKRLVVRISIRNAAKISALPSWKSATVR